MPDNVLFDGGAGETGWRKFLATCDVIAVEMVEDLRSALEQFEALLADLPAEMGEEEASPENPAGYWGPARNCRPGSLRYHRSHA